GRAPRATGPGGHRLPGPDGAVLLDRADADTARLDHSRSDRRRIPGGRRAAGPLRPRPRDAHRLLRAVLGLPRPRVHPAVSRRRGGLAGDTPVRSERPRPPPVLVLLGAALLLEQPLLAPPGGRTPAPAMAWRGRAGLEPRLAGRHPGPL